MVAVHGLDLVEPVIPIDIVRGAKYAHVTMVRYGDYECSTCRAAEPGVRIIIRHYSTAVRLTYRHYPIEGAHPHALIAAAAAQGQFWAMHDLLLEQGAGLSRKSLDGYAAQLGLDMVYRHST